MDWKKHRAELLDDPEVQKAHKELEPEFQIAKALFEARVKRGLTQKELARRLKTKQSVISRVETAKTMPSLSFLKRLAKTLGGSLRVEFDF